MRDERSGVLCAGSIVVDIGKVIDGYPEPERLATIEQVSVSTGGPGLNMAVDLRQLGASFPVWMCGAVGDDQNAEFVLAECARHGIDTTRVRAVADAATSFTDAMIERAGGRRTFFHHFGANALFDGRLLEIESTRARILHAGAPGIHPFMDASIGDGDNGWSQLLRRAHDAGVHTNLELVSGQLNWITDLVPPCLPHVSSVVINEVEAAALLGVPTPRADLADPDGIDWPALEQLALELIRRGVSTLAVVHFPAGCVAATPGGRTWRRGSVRVPPGEVRNTTGAGDALAAGVILGVHERWPVEQCLRLGVAAAAACIRGPDTSGSIAPWQTCLADADALGYRDSEPVDGPPVRS